MEAFLVPRATEHFPSPRATEHFPSPRATEHFPALSLNLIIGHMILVQNQSVAIYGKQRFSISSNILINQTCSSRFIYKTHLR